MTKLTETDKSQLIDCVFKKIASIRALQTLSGEFTQLQQISRRASRSSKTLQGR